MSRFTSGLLVIGLFATATACMDSGEDPSGSGPDGTGWESAVTTTDDGSIIIQKVSYRSGGLRIFGQVCRPVGSGPFPLVVANHGGLTGLPAWNGGSCAESARQGYMQIESAYRGQDGSGGIVELCLGEVDDALNMLEIALELPEVDRERVVMWGAAHGGCVTTRALQRGAKVKAAASVFGISNMKTEYEFWRNQLAAGVGPIVQYRMMIDYANAGIGGAPEDFPEEYQRRSPLELATEIPEGIPFLIAHGVEDQLVPAKQSCELAKRLGVQGHHFNEQHQLVGTTPPGCESMWTPTNTPTSGWSGSRYLLVYDGLAHSVGGPATAMDSDVQAFLTAKLR